MAKNASIVSVKILGCPAPGGQISSITTEHVCWGLDWIRSLNNPYRSRRGALVNMSFYQLTEEPLIGAMEHVINGLVLTDYDLASGRPPWSGIPVIVSANNQDGSACAVSPSRMAYGNELGFASPGRVISVGGTRRSDQRWDCDHPPSGVTGEVCTTTDPGSNFGPCVDIYAPAHDINSASLFSSTSIRVRPDSRSGTSFSAPIVSGVVARMLQTYPNFTPRQVWDFLRLYHAVPLQNPEDPHGAGVLRFVQAISEESCVEH